MEEKIGRIIKRFFWVPLALGVIGYSIVGNSPLWQGLYESGALYFVNPVSSVENIWVTLAKLSAMLVATGVVLGFIGSVYRAMDRFWCHHFADSTAVYTDTEDGRKLLSTIRHGFPGRMREHGGPEKAKHQILFLEEDTENLELYDRWKDRFGDSQVYLLLKETDPFQLGVIDRPNVHFINIYEVMARRYWRKNHLYEVRENPEYAISIVGYGPVGRAIFRYGYLNNLYSLGQKITYHIWGAFPSETEFLKALPTENGDRIVLHEKEWRADLDTIARADRVILTLEEDALELAQEILYRNGGVQIHYYSASGSRWGDYLASDRVTCFGVRSEYLTEEDIKTERLFRIGKLFNYDYALRYAEADPEHFEEGEMEREWIRLNGFKKSSSIARGDHYWIEKKNREAGLETEDELWRLEHFRWSRYHYINHWTYAPERDNAARKHPYLVPYDDLEQSIKELDGFYSRRIQKEIEALIEENL
ncbi:MAG: hypothetical protein IKS07_09555 [Lachnospiraceae bacterium]|nr:hypothetical protein [Lachnospiraceae bacterium]